MNENLAQISRTARKAARRQDWATVDACAQNILEHDSVNPEGFFLTGLVMKASRQPAKATEAFARALELDADRYDAAIELANQHSFARRNADAAALLARYEGKLGNSPLYLDLGGTVYADIGMPERAWPLYQKANELQPGVDLFQANLAACGVYLGKVEEAKHIYKRLLERFPTHQRNHYQLARLEEARDTKHIEQMKEVLRSTNLSPDKNIFGYYAIGKELEDLGQWDEAFHYYKMAGDAVASVSNYDVDTDLQLIDKIIEVCNKDWLAAETNEALTDTSGKLPIFIVGLPRTGTTLTERILSSHSQVESVGETEFIQMVLRRESGVESVEKMNLAMIEAVAKKDIRIIGNGYLDAVNYKLSDIPMFIDKLPFNFLYLGFIAKAYPHARIIHLKRNPMDACFAMYKQVFTWAYKFSYTLEGLGRYYVAYERLCNHWRDVLEEQQIEIEYESVVADQEGQTRALLEKLGLDFEEACLNFDQNITASTTASSVQVREKIHTRSVNRWKHFAKQLQPLKDDLGNAGIAVE
jgi:tetratricopeptide (TPR) repeat protein